MKKKVCMSGKAFKKEHVKLLRVLKKGSKKEREAEAADQAKEMKQYFGKKQKAEEAAPVFVVGIRLCESKLTTKSRKKIKGSNFALPGRRYPIHDESHARNALARVSQHGTPEEKAKVRAAVSRKYPGIVQEARLLELSSDLLTRAAKVAFSRSRTDRKLARDTVGVGQTLKKASPSARAELAASARSDLRKSRKHKRQGGRFTVAAVKKILSGSEDGRFRPRYSSYERFNPEHAGFSHSGHYTSGGSGAPQRKKLGVGRAAAIAGIGALGAYGAYKGAKYLHKKYKQWRGRESMPLQELSASTMMRASSIALAKGKKEQSGRIKRGLFKSRGGLAARMPAKPQKPTLVQAWRAKVSGMQK